MLSQVIIPLEGLPYWPIYICKKGSGGVGVGWGGVECGGGGG